MIESPLRYLIELDREVLPETTDPNRAFRYIDISQVASDGSLTVPDATISFAEAPSRARRLARAGDTVVSTVRTYLRAIAEVPPSKECLVFSTGFAVLSPKFLHGRYLYYACRSTPFVEEVVSRSTGVSYPAINSSELLGIKIPHPPLDEQRRIADFLDDRVARIDRIIAARREQVELSGNYFLALARELTSSAGPSWGRPRVSQIFRIGSGCTPPSEDKRYYDGDIPWVNTGDIKDGPLSSTARRVTQLAIDELPALKIHNPGALVIAMYGQGSTKGRVALLRDSVCVNQACCVLDSGNDSLNTWAFYWFRAYKSDLVALANGAGQPNLSQEILRAVQIPTPTAGQRSHIVEQLALAEQRLTSIQAALDQSVLILTEYKSFLITAAVTGELDVTTARSGILI